MSGFYIGADGKARKVKGAYIGVDGVARKIKKGYIGDENGAARLCWSAFDGDPVFANNTWEQIIEACHYNVVPDTWDVGDSKPMTINGKDYAIDIIGKTHDDYSDGRGKAPLTFQLHDLYETKYTLTSSNANSGGWEPCLMRTTHIPDIFALMPAEVQNGIREVNKLTSKGSRNTAIVTTADKLFLLSEIEVFGSITHSVVGEGTQYAYYAAGNSTRKYLNGSSENWWERSPDAETSAAFCLVYNGGANKNVYPSTNRMGVSFAFCF